MSTSTGGGGGATPRTWHHGLVAEWWAEFGDDLRPHEVDYVRRLVEAEGGPALDAGCGAGRLLIPFLQAGLDVDGCDVSPDMIAACRTKAARAGLSPRLHVQALHELDLPRRYRTVAVVGTFGLGSTRERDVEALGRLRDHLEPGGVLLIDQEMPYANPRLWGYWPRDGRASLPEPRPATAERRRAADGSEYALRSWVVGADPLAQRVTMRMAAERWRDGTLEQEEEHTLDIGLYFAHEMLLMLRSVGFSDVTVHGEHQERPPLPDDDFLVFLARR